MKGERQMKKTLSLMVCATFLLSTGCTTVQRGALAGSALGAGTGAIIGHQSGETGPGALLGAGVGALLGALTSDLVEDHNERYAHIRREEHYHARTPEPAYIPRVADAGNIKSVEPHYEYETKQVWKDTSHDERIWVPEHTKGNRRIQGHWEVVQVDEGHWETVQDKIWVQGY